MAKYRPKEIIKQRNRRLIAVTIVIVLFILGYSTYWWFTEKDWGSVVEILAENTQPVNEGKLLLRLDGAKAKIDLRRAETERGVAVRHIVTLQKSAETITQRIADELKKIRSAWVCPP